MKIVKPLADRGATAATTEGELVARARSGDLCAFEQLVAQYHRFVWSVALRMTGDETVAEEVTQEVFITLFRKIGQFKGGSAFSTWLYRVAVNRTLTELERNNRERDRTAATGIDELAGESSAGREIEKREAKEELNILLAELDPDRRLAVILREIEELSYEEIARVTDVPIGTVRSRIARGRRELFDSAKKRRG